MVYVTNKNSFYNFRYVSHFHVLNFQKYNLKQPLLEKPLLCRYPCKDEGGRADVGHLSTAVVPTLGNLIAYFASGRGHLNLVF